MEDRSMLATISGYVWDDLNANGIRDTAQLTFQGNPPIVVMMVDVSDTAAFFTLPGSTVGDVNQDGFANTFLDNEIYAYIQLNRKLIANGFGQTGRVILIGYGADAVPVDFSSDIFPDPRDLTLFAQVERFVVNPAFDANGDNIPDIETMLTKFQLGWVPQNGATGNPVDNTNRTSPGGFDPRDPLSPNFGSPNFLDVDTDELNYTNAHDLALSLLRTEPIVPTATGLDVPALPGFANRVTIINFATQAFEDINYADPNPTNLDTVPSQRLLGVEYYAFGMGFLPSLTQLRLIRNNARNLQNFAELEGFVSGNRFTELGVGGARVYIDANNNGRYDVGERLATTSNDVAGTPLDESGNYQFTGLGPGTYIVRQDLPLNFSQTFPSQAFYRIVISNSGQVISTCHFARSANNVIRGLVFNDGNDDGIQSTGERGIANVRVYIDVNRNGRRDFNEPTAVTIRDIVGTTIDETGQYSFINVAPGTYIIRAEAPTGFSVTSPIAGTTAALGARVNGDLSWTVTFPIVINNFPIRSVSNVNFSVVRGPRVPQVTTSAGIATYTEGQHLTTRRTLVDPRLTVDLRGNTANGATLAVSLIQNGDFNDKLFVRNGGGVTFVNTSSDPSFPSWDIFAGGQRIGVVEGGVESSPLIFTFNGLATNATIQAAARQVEYQNPDPNITNLRRAVSYQITLPGGQFSNLPVRFINVVTINNAPVLGPNAFDAISYTAGDPALQVYSGVTVTDSDNPANFVNGTLTVTPTGSVGLGDTITIEEVGGITLANGINGVEVYFGGLLMGNVAADSGEFGSALEITLTNNATPAAVEALIAAIRFSASSTVARPAGTTTLDLVLTEAQVNGRSNTISVEIAVDGAPVAAFLAMAMESTNTRKR